MAGISSKKVTLGIPRLKELIDNARTVKSPSMTLHLTPEFMNDAPDRLEGKLRQLKAAIEHVTLKDVVEDSEIIYDPDPYATTVEADKGWLSLLMSIPDEYRPEAKTLSRWVMRIVVDRQKMWSHCMGLGQIGEALQKTLAEDGWVVWSDDNDDALVMHVRLFDEEVKSVPMDTYFSQIRDALFASVTLKGIRDVTSAEAEQIAVRSLGGNGLAKETVIETAGINMAEVCEVEGVDPTRITCNSPREVLDFLGVEAARATLFAEIRKVIQYDGSYINAHHLSVQCDAMTRDGVIMSITRHGVNRQISSPFTKASFEETCDILLSAAMDAERDDLTGISPSLILGQYPRAGTGTFDLLLDEAKLSASPPLAVVEETVDFEEFNWADDV